MGDPTGSYIIHATADPAVGQLLAALDRPAAPARGAIVHRLLPCGLWVGRRRNVQTSGVRGRRDFQTSIWRECDSQMRRCLNVAAMYKHRP